MKFLILGPLQSGKTSYLHRLIEEEVLSEHKGFEKPESVSVHLFHPNGPCDTVETRDTPESPLSEYDGVLVLFAAYEKGYQQAVDWVIVLQRMKIPVVLAENKLDQRLRRVRASIGLGLHRALLVPFFEISVKENTVARLTEPFEKLKELCERTL